MESEKKFLIFLIIFSFIIRLIPSFLFISPTTPHDFTGIILYIESFLNGNLYTDLYNGIPSQYGGLFSATVALWTLIFGKSYYSIIIPYIIFDVLNIIVVFYIAKTLTNSNVAKYVSFLFAISYIILSNVYTGSTNTFFMFFTLLSLFFLLREKPNFILSAIFLAMSIGYKAVPIIFIPPIVYYIYKIVNIKEAIKYFLILIFTLLLIIFPFYLQSGNNAFFPYFPNNIVDFPLGANFLTLYQYLDYFFIVGYNTPYENYVFPNEISQPFFMLGFLLCLLYMIKYQLKDKKLELLRNCFLLIFTGLMFGKVFYAPYTYWFLPFILLIVFYIEKDKFSNFLISWLDIFGFILIFVGVLIASILYRWAIEYTVNDKMLMLMGTIYASIGTYILFRNSSLKFPITIIVFANALEYQLHAYLLTIFGSFIPILSQRKFAWGIMGFGINVLVIIGMIYLFMIIHNKTKYTKNKYI